MIYYSSIMIIREIRCHPHHIMLLHPLLIHVPKLPMFFSAINRFVNKWYQGFFISFVFFIPDIISNFIRHISSFIPNFIIKLLCNVSKFLSFQILLTTFSTCEELSAYLSIYLLKYSFESMNLGIILSYF